MADQTYANRGMYALDEFSSDMERMLDSLWGRAVGPVLRNGKQNKFALHLDISETPESYIVQADVPGVPPENVNVEMHEGKLVISGNRQTVDDSQENSFHRLERLSGSFQRTIALPTEIDVDNIDAQYQHGVLQVTLPKVEKQQPRKIEVKH